MGVAAILGYLRPGWGRLESRRLWSRVPIHRAGVLLGCVFVVTACEKTEWLDEPPLVVRGVWVEQTDRVLKGLETADTVHVARDAVRFVRYDPYEVIRRSLCSPIRTVSKTGDRYVLFCGARDEDHIAQTRLEMEIGELGRMAFISEVRATGVSDQSAAITWGRFGPP